MACHTTAGRNPLATFLEGYHQWEGVGCESCHGAGSAYAASEVMRDRRAFLANGGRIPNEQTCRDCHRDEAFRPVDWFERLRHWRE